MSFRQWRAYVLAPKISNWKDSICQFIAWRMMPKRLVNWAAIRLMVHATQGKWSTQVVPELLAMDALKRWNEENHDGTESSSSEDKRRGSCGSTQESSGAQGRSERGSVSCPIYASPQNWPSPA